MDFDVGSILGDQDDVCVLTCREVLEAQVQGLLEVCWSVDVHQDLVRTVN